MQVQALLMLPCKFYVVLVVNCVVPPSLHWLALIPGLKGSGQKQHCITQSFPILRLLYATKHLLAARFLNQYHPRHSLLVAEWPRIIQITDSMSSWHPRFCDFFLENLAIVCGICLRHYFLWCLRLAWRLSRGLSLKFEPRSHGCLD